MAAHVREVNETAHFTCIWKLENIGATFDLYSPTLTAQAIEMTKWKLKMYCGIAGPIILLISRVNKDDGPDKIEIKFELSFLNIGGLPLIKEVGKKQFLKGDHFIFPKFADEYQVFFHRRREFLPKGMLTIRCRMWKTEAEISMSDLFFARSLFEADRCCYDLVIDKFSGLQVGYVRKFLLNPPSTKEYNLTLQFYITEKNAQESLCIDIKYHGIAWYNIKICLLDFEKKVVHSDERSGTFCCSFFDFFKRNELIEDESSLLPNDVLTLRCEIEGKPKIAWNRIENYSFLNSRSLATQEGGMHFVEQDQTLAIPSFSKDSLKCLLKEGTFSDLSFQRDSRSFPSYKCILNGLYPIFKAMFNGDMKKMRKCVEIPDLNEDTLRELLSHFYMEAVGELQWFCATDLSKAEDKYELLELKRKCESFLKSHFSAGSVYNTPSRTKKNSVSFRYATRNGILSLRFVAKRQKAKF